MGKTVGDGYEYQTGEGEEEGTCLSMLLVTLHTLRKGTACHCLNLHFDDDRKL